MSEKFSWLTQKCQKVSESVSEIGQIGHFKKEKIFFNFKIMFSIVLIALAVSFFLGVFISLLFTE